MDDSSVWLIIGKIVINYQAYFSYQGGDIFGYLIIINKDIMVNVVRPLLQFVKNRFAYIQLYTHLYRKFPQRLSLIKALIFSGRSSFLWGKKKFETSFQ